MADSTMLALVLVCVICGLAGACAALRFWRRRRRQLTDSAATHRSDESTLPRRIRKKNKDANGRPSYLSGGGGDHDAHYAAQRPSNPQNSRRNGLLASVSSRLRQTGFFGTVLFPTSNGSTQPSTTLSSGGGGGPSPATLLRTQSVEDFCKDSKALTALLDDARLLPKRIPYDELTFLRSLSKGAFGEVWLGQLETSHVAIKCLLPEKRMFRSSMEQFAAEIQLMSLLDHPNVVSFVGVSWRRMEDLCAIVEYMEAGDLDDVLRKHKHKLSWNKDKIAIAMDVAEGLVYLHCMRPVIVHRDLKSKNVLLNRQWHAKLSDFGVSRKTEINETMTSGVGTLLWTAPEIIEGKKYSEQADVYSLGVVLSEIDTCEPPFEHVKNEAGEKLPPMQIAQSVRLGKVRVQLRDDCPLKMRELVLACTQLDPDRRPTAMQVAFTLKSIIAPTLQRAVPIAL